MAAPAIPTLKATEPESTETAPGSSLTPAILGEAEPGDIIIEVFPFATAWSAPTTHTVQNPTKHPEYKIEIFLGAECPGAPVWHGTAEQLETSGITVAATPDAATTYSAEQVDPANEGAPSECSNPLTYWEGNFVPVGGSPEGGGSETPSGGSSGGGTIGPAAPAGGKPDAPRLHMLPRERANDATPLVAGSAPGANSVSVYASSDCNGTPVAKGSPSQLSAGLQVSVPMNSSTTFSAVAIGNGHSGCSDPVTYTEDSTAPRTRITMGPGVKTRKRKAVFRFMDITEDPPGTTFACKVDKARWKPCSSPFHLKHLKPGHYTVKIRATDVAGNVEPKPVKRRFIVVSRSRR